MKDVAIPTALAFAVTLLPAWTFAGSQEVAEQIATHIQQSGRLTNYHIHISVEAGAATIRGSVSSQQQMDLAIQLAREVPGVRCIVNELKIAPELMNAGQTIPREDPKAKPETSPEAPPAVDRKEEIRIAFLEPAGATVVWSVSTPRAVASEPATCPTFCALREGTSYRLRIGNLPGRPGVELSLTLDIRPLTPQTRSFLARNLIPVYFNEEDIAQVLAGKPVINVVYLPDEHSSELMSGVETLMSSRADAKVDPIAEADRRGAILAIVRMTPFPELRSPPRAPRR